EDPVDPGQLLVVDVHPARERFLSAADVEPKRRGGRGRGGCTRAGEELHAPPSALAKKAPSAAATTFGFSTGERWPAPGISTNSAPGMEEAISRAGPGGVIASSSPAATSVGIRISGSSSLWSARSRIAARSD